MKALLLAVLAAAAIVSVKADTITAQTCTDGQCSQGCTVGSFEAGVCTSANNGGYMLGACNNGVASVGIYTSADCSGSALFNIGESCGLLFSNTYASATCSSGEGAPARKTVRLAYFIMGIDLTGIQKKKRTVRHHTLSTNPYIKLLVKLYKFLAQRTNSAFNKTVYTRLVKSRNNRPPISLSRVAICMKRKSVWLKGAAPIAVVVGDVTDDIRLNKIPALRVAALRFTKTARASIKAAGGECLTFDQLALIAPTGKNTFLLRGKKHGRDSEKHFGAAGKPGSHAKPHVSSRGAEVSRGRRSSKAYKRSAFKHV